MKEDKDENSKLKKFMYVVSLILFLVGFIPTLASYKLVIYLIAVILSGYDLIIEGIKNIFHLNFEEDTLMTIAVISAFCIGEYPESVAIILLFKLGEFIEDKAVEKANKNINSIASLKIQTANLVKGKETKIVNVEELKVGDTIIVKPGETVPVDSKIIKGESALNTSKLTGESEPVFVNEGKDILSGSINQTGILTCKVTKEYKNSAIAKIVDLVYEATNNKGKKEEYITKFSRIYTPTVIAIAVLLAILPTVLGADFVTWLYRALVFLVASCPCSIVISIPLAYFSSIGAISKKGLLIKGTKHIEDLAKSKILALDKTGTITTGKMKIKDFIIIKENAEHSNLKKVKCISAKIEGKENEKTKALCTKEKLIQYVYSLEANSNHPVSNAIIEYAKENEIDKLEVENQKEIAGCGIYGKIEGKDVIIGNKKMLDKYKIYMDCKIDNLKQKSGDSNEINEKKKEVLENAVLIAVDNKLVAYMLLSEKIRDGFKETLSKLYEIGIKKVVMLTGDSAINAEKIAEECEKIDIKDKQDNTKDIKKHNFKMIKLEYKAKLMPEGKVEEINKLKEEGKVIFVGDGINDSPVLATSDFGIAMGEGTDIASTTADSILISNNIGTLPEIIKIARKTIRIVNENITISLLAKLIVLILGILGIAPVWLAVAGDTGITLLTVINSIRIFKNNTLHNI